MKSGTFRRALAGLLSLLLCVFLCPAASAAMTEATARPKAEQLQALDLFRGVDEAGSLELDRAPTRAEALVMLVRLLGKESEALAFKGTCPFSDVAGWAVPYVAWAYDQGLTKGVSDTSFGGDGTATLNMYLTFVLRALGFEEGSDFTWEDPLALASWWMDPIPYAAVQAPFLRADAAAISHAALSARVKLTRSTLADTLIEAGAFTREAFADSYDSAPYADPTYEAAVSSLPGLEGGSGGTVNLLAEIDGQGGVYEVLPSGLPHIINGFYFVFSADSYAGEGRILSLAVPQADTWMGSVPTNFQLMEEAHTLTYEAQGYDRAELSGGTLKDYRYTLDLTTGMTTVTSRPAQS